MKYVLVNTSSGNVFAGYLEIRNGKELALLKAISIGILEGYDLLFKLAIEGTKESDKYSFTREIDRILILDAIEILYVTKKAEYEIRISSIEHEIKQIK